MPTETHLLSRRTALSLSAALPLMIAGCGRRDDADVEPVMMVPLTYDYLTKLRLNVATLDIDDSWQAPYGPAQVGPFSPIPPVAALRQMAQDRIVTGGTSGRAMFKIADASIVLIGDRLQATFAVVLTVATTDGASSGYAEARVLHTTPYSGGGRGTLRNALYAITRATMDDMNVEFEYQVKRSLRDYLMTGDTPQLAPPPDPVQSQDLSNPSSAPSPAPALPSPSQLAPRLQPPPQQPFPQLLAPPSATRL